MAGQRDPGEMVSEEAQVADVAEGLLKAGAPGAWY